MQQLVDHQTLQQHYDSLRPCQLRAREIIDHIRRRHRKHWAPRMNDPRLNNQPTNLHLGEDFYQITVGGRSDLSFLPFSTTFLPLLSLLLPFFFLLSLLLAP